MTSFVFVWFGTQERERGHRVALSDERREPPPSISAPLGPKASPMGRILLLAEVVAALEGLPLAVKGSSQALEATR